MDLKPTQANSGGFSLSEFLIAFGSQVIWKKGQGICATPIIKQSVPVLGNH